VLPGPAQACPPVQQKYTAIRRKPAANSYFFNSATFPLFHIIFLLLTLKTKTQFFSYFNSFTTLSSSNIFGTKFRCFSATFRKIDSGTAIMIPPLLVFIFR
jgi:hypothetical protein